MGIYFYPKGRNKVPKGTNLKVTAWHDNTAGKKSNPDPNQWAWAIAR